MRSRQRLYDLLPAYIRFRDQQMRDPELGVAPLEALIQALEMPFHALEENIDSLYRGWFIETCDEWKVPYIADLLGIRGLDEVGAVIPGQRSRVANTIAYRLRKGTPAALARAAQDATGWPCHVEEMRHLTGASQDLSAPRPHRSGTVDLRDWSALQEVDTPFDTMVHTADLRHGISAASGGFHPGTLGLTFWRLESYPLLASAARPSEMDPDRGYRCHPSGVDSPLFNAPETPSGCVYETQPRHLPTVLRHSDLAREIASIRLGEANETGFLAREPAFRISVSYRSEDDPTPISAADFVQIPPEEIAICNLSNWQEADEVRPLPDWERVQVALDPATGRLLFPGVDPDRRVRVDFCYGASGDLGGGPYPRRDRDPRTTAAHWRALVDQDRPASIQDGEPRYVTLSEALNAWRNADPVTAEIVIADSGLHPVGDLEIDLAENKELALIAKERSWPHLQGGVVVRGGANSRMRLDGLGLEGGLELQGEPSLTLEHCTVHPPPGQRAIEYSGLGAGSRHFEVEIDHSIVTAPIQLPMAMRELLISNSIIDGGGGEAIQGAVVEDWKGPEPDVWIGPPTRIKGSTIHGSASLHQLWFAANTLFTGPVRAERPRDGHAEYCYFRNGSITPPRKHCLEGPHTAEGTWLHPSFTSTDYGHPGYFQLTACSRELRRGGEDGNEIGVFHDLRYSDRMSNLDAVLDEYLPSGFDAKISFET